MIRIRSVQPEDQSFWYSLDPHLPLDQFLRKIRDRQGYVLFENGEAAGILRYQLFWDRIPFCTMLSIAVPFRGRQLGMALMAQWEQDMLALGYDMVMVSTQSDETAQKYYRMMGYRDAGALVMNIPGHEQPMELFLTKKLLPGCACTQSAAESSGK